MRCLANDWISTGWGHFWPRASWWLRIVVSIWFRVNCTGLINEIVLIISQSRRDLNKSPCVPLVLMLRPIGIVSGSVQPSIGDFYAESVAQPCPVDTYSCLSQNSSFADSVSLSDIFLTRFRLVSPWLPQAQISDQFTYDIGSAVLAAEGCTLAHRGSILARIAYSLCTSSTSGNVSRATCAIAFVGMVPCSLAILWCIFVCGLRRSMITRWCQAYWSRTIPLVEVGCTAWSCGRRDIALVWLDGCRSFHLFIMN